MKRARVRLGGHCARSFGRLRSFGGVRRAFVRKLLAGRRRSVERAAAAAATRGARLFGRRERTRRHAGTIGPSRGLLTTTRRRRKKTLRKLKAEQRRREAPPPRPKSRSARRAETRARKAGDVTQRMEQWETGRRKRCHAKRSAKVRRDLAAPDAPIWRATERKKKEAGRRAAAREATTRPRSKDAAFPPDARATLSRERLRKLNRHRLRQIVDASAIDGYPNVYATRPHRSAATFGDAADRRLVVSAPMPSRGCRRFEAAAAPWSATASNAFL